MLAALLAALAAVALLLVTVAVLGVGVALVLTGVVGAALASPADRALEIPPRLGFATIALLGLLIFTLATLAIVPQLA